MMFYESLFPLIMIWWIENRCVPFALTAVKGVGRRYAFVVCKKAEIDPCRRAGELDEDEVER